MNTQPNGTGIRTSTGINSTKDGISVTMKNVYVPMNRAMNTNTRMGILYLTTLLISLFLWNGLMASTVSGQSVSSDRRPRPVAPPCCNPFRTDDDGELRIMMRNPNPFGVIVPPLGAIGSPVGGSSGIQDISGTSDTTVNRLESYRRSLETFRRVTEEARREGKLLDTEYQTLISSYQLRVAEYKDRLKDLKFRDQLQVVQLEAAQQRNIIDGLRNEVTKMDAALKLKDEEIERLKKELESLKPKP